MEMHLSSWMMCLFFVTLEKSAAFSTSARSTRWHKFPSDSADIDETSAVAVGSRSVKECAIRCLDHVNCDRFCYDVMNAVCYVTGVVTSSTPVSDPERRCYEVNSAPAPGNVIVISFFYSQ
ncbi:hypothetical protein BaRGS_00011123 [Batillaria attramentaria]|uniref:Apple domain-containing protein n=1 Tax=Batillaria attramentaria TaxID=370345 RepID=A0ABD0LER8_9CAEN